MMLDEQENGSEELFAGLETSEDVDTSVKNVVVSDAPEITSPEWSDHVMSMFCEDELINGMPLAAGLRRVAEIVMGPIVDTGPVQIFPVQNENGTGRATVMWRVEFANGTRFADVADCYEGNTDDNFCPFAVATAATRAEARALRKALRLRKVSADEVTSKDTAAIARENSSMKEKTSGEYNSADRITSPQANFVDVKLKQLNIDGKKFFKEVYGLSTARKITKQQGTSAIKTLNTYQNNASEIPHGILGYNKDWRD